MNKLFIIGNGFDLAHGLKTSYENFIIWYFNQAISEYLSNGSYSDNHIIHSILKLPDNLISINSIEELSTITSTGRNGNFIKLIEPFGKNLVNTLSLNDWVDIEQTYYNLLVKFINEPIYTSNDKVGSIKHLNSSIEYLKTKLIEYLKTIHIRNNSRQSSIYEAIWNVITSSIKNNAQAVNNKNPTQEENIESILFVSFNYTDTLVNLYNPLSMSDDITNVEIINIHGSINDASTPEKIIFGYGDEMDEYYRTIENLNYNEFLKNIKSFGYYLSDNYKKLLTFINSDNFEVHLMGHSCGLSDRVLLNTVFEHNNCKNIQIYYHDKGNNQNNFTDLTMNISRHFNDKAKMRERVSPITECKPLVPF